VGFSGPTPESSEARLDIAPTLIDSLGVAGIFAKKKEMRPKKVNSLESTGFGSHTSDLLQTEMTRSTSLNTYHIPLPSRVQMDDDGLLDVCLPNPLLLSPAKTARRVNNDGQV